MPQSMRLTAAAARLGLSYGQTLRLVLIKKLAGWQDPENSSWWVDNEELERFEEARTKDRVRAEDQAISASEGHR